MAYTENHERYVYYVRVPSVYQGTLQEWLDDEAEKVRKRLSAAFVIALPLTNDQYHNYIEKL